MRALCATNRVIGAHQFDQYRQQRHETDRQQHCDAERCGEARCVGRRGAGGGRRQIQRRRLQLVAAVRVAGVERQPEQKEQARDKERAANGLCRAEAHHFVQQRKEHRSSA